MIGNMIAMIGVLEKKIEKEAAGIYLEIKKQK